MFGFLFESDFFLFKILNFFKNINLSTQNY